MIKSNCVAGAGNAEVLLVFGRFGAVGIGPGWLWLRVALCIAGARVMFLFRVGSGSGWFYLFGSVLDMPLGCPDY